MRERDVASSFKDIFDKHYILCPVSATSSGWPDRLIVLPDSRTVAVEQKRIKVNLEGSFTLNALRNDQCAWLAKWQKAGGLCFLFFGLYTGRDTSIGLSVITVPSWRSWIGINSHTYSVNDIRIMTPTEIYNWFCKYVGFVDITPAMAAD